MMEAPLQAVVVLAAFALDFWVGDPLWLPHPVRWMGAAIRSAEPIFRRLRLPPVLAGVFFNAVLVFGTWTAAWLLTRFVFYLNPPAGRLLDILLLYFCLSVRSLQKEAMAVYYALHTDPLEKARFAVARIVGRDTADLDADGVARAAVESVAENFVDGVLAPLTFFLIGGPALALAYKMVNTLDSMVGYRNPRYEAFGKASARLDDLANLLPARLSVPLVALAAQLLGGTGRLSMKTALKEGADHTSPNAGYSEAAFAGALKVKLNGPAVYDGVPVIKPYLGKAFGPVRARHILQACDLMLLTSLLAALLGAALQLLIY